ncbi:MAG: isopentenyl phosphate kinase [Acidobacteria bacterium]|nr:isopentenyl phosphate kinase [Acidobacteriota bacterium]
MQPCSIVKLGGSLITNKTGTAAFCDQMAIQLAEELARHHGPVVLLHGTGSFGKPPVHKYGYKDGFLSRSNKAIVAEVSALLNQLRGRMLTTLVEAGVPAISLSATTIFENRNGEIVFCNSRPLLKLLERGMVPVISGDLVVDLYKDFAVCSSDIMAARLAVELAASRLIFATDMDGVMDYSGAIPTLVREVAPNDPKLASIDRSIDDISGGMAAKLEAGFAAAAAGIETLIIDGRVCDRLFRALGGMEVVGTRVLWSETKSHILTGDVTTSGHKSFSLADSFPS